MQFGADRSTAAAEVETAIRRCFWYAAQADKFDGAVHQTKSANVTLAMHEPLGVMGLVCSTVHPLLGLVSLVMPAIAMGNSVIAVPSQTHPLAATDFYQVLETSDVPGGVVSIVSGPRDDLARTLAQHDGVAGMWYVGGREGTKMVEAESAGNLKQTLHRSRRRPRLVRPAGLRARLPPPRHAGQERLDSLRRVTILRGRRRESARGRCGRCRRQGPPR